MKAKFLLLPAFILAIGIVSVSAQTKAKADSSQTHHKHHKQAKSHSEKKSDETKKEVKKPG